MNPVERAYKRAMPEKTDAEIKALVRQRRIEDAAALRESHADALVRAGMKGSRAKILEHVDREIGAQPVGRNE